MYPQDDNNQLYTWKPQKGARVHVVVGDAVDGSTLLAEVSQSVVRAPKDAALWNHGDMPHVAVYICTRSFARLGLNIVPQEMLA